jgi:steroid delta-isomerase-like uncharacterized protein
MLMKKLHMTLGLVLILTINVASASEEEMFAVWRDMVTAFNVHDVEGWAEHLADDAVFDYVPTPPPMEGKEAIGNWMANLFQAFPDIRWETQRRFTSGNILVEEFIISATQEGEWMGIPPTGNSGQASHLNIVEFEEDKVKRITTYLDNATVLVQLGIMPAPELPELKPSFSLPNPEPTGLAPVEAEIEIESRFTHHNLAEVAKMVHPDAEIRFSTLGMMPMNRDTYAAVLELILLSNSTIRSDILRVIDLGDGWILSELIVSGRNDGPYFGIPASERPIEVRAAKLAHYDSDGLLTNLTLYFDNLTVLQQIGAFPPLVDTEANKALHRYLFEEVWNQKKLEVADEIYSDDYIYHPLFPNPMGDMDKEARKQFIAAYLNAFPDLHFTIEDQIASGDLVVTRWSATGTQKEELMGIPPQENPKPGTTTGIDIVRIVNGKIVEVWGSFDMLGMLEQMGVIPPTREDYTWGEPSKVTGDPGTPEENIAISERSKEELWNWKNLDVLDEICSPDFIAHNPAIPGSPFDFESYKQVCLAYITAFPDLQAVHDETIAEGDRVAIRWTATGTHLGELMGIPPTGKKVKFTGIAINRFANGKMVEQWWSWDAISLMQQLGAIPPMQKDYSNVFFMTLSSGLNMISIPLEPRTPFTARSLAEHLSATMIIKLDEKSQKFIGWTPDAPDDGFPIEGGKGYIVNVLEGKVVAFTGAAWTQPPMPAAPSVLSDAWAFVLSGRLKGNFGDRYIVTVKNIRTGEVVTDTVRSGYFAAAFADLNCRSVVKEGDKLEVVVRDSSGEIASEPFIYEVTSNSLRRAALSVILEGVGIPDRTALLPNYPNPFNPETWIPFKLAEAEDVVIRIYDPSGKLIRTIDLGHRDAGFYLSRDRAACWDGRNELGERVSSGFYFYQLQVGDFSSTRKMLIVK